MSLKFFLCKAGNVDYHIVEELWAVQDLSFFFEGSLKPVIKMVTLLVEQTDVSRERF